MHKPVQSLPQSGVLRKEFEANQRRAERRQGVFESQSLDPLLSLIEQKAFSMDKFKALADNLQLDQNPNNHLACIVAALCLENKKAFEYLCNYALIDPKSIGVIKGRTFEDLITSASK